MATRYIDKITTADTNKLRDLPDAHGIATDTADGFIKYNDSGTVRTIVNTDEAQTLSNKTLVAPSFTDSSTVAVERVARFAISGDALHAANLTAFTAPAACVITRAILNITTQSTGASTIDIGLTATTATTTSDTLLDGVSGAAVAVFDSADAGLDSGANDMAQALASGKWVTIDEASGDTSGLVGVLFIYYILA
jgi:hypothetical protein